MGFREYLTNGILPGSPVFLLRIVLLCALLIPAGGPPVSAADPDVELKKVEKKLRQEKVKVEQIIKQEKSAVVELEKITRTLSNKQQELKHFDRRITNTRSSIRAVENDIQLMNRKLDARASILKKRLRNLYRQLQGGIADTLVSAEDHQDLIKKMKYITFIAGYDSRLMKQYSSELQELNGKMEHLEVLKKELEMNRISIQRATEELKAERKNKDNLLAAIKTDRLSYEKMVRELEDASERLREMIRKLDEDEADDFVPAENFSSMKGLLPWPVFGKVVVPFGKQKDPQFNVTTYRKGIEIASDLGSAVLAVAQGRIVFADWFKGYGRLVIINHGGGYHTLYGNLSEIFHKTGDIIKRRQAVGKVGESGVQNVPSLYFEIRYKGKPLDPAYWLKKMKK